jgi:hypothetical protein
MYSEFLEYASFVCDKALLTAAVLREKIEDTLYTGVSEGICHTLEKCSIVEIALIQPKILKYEI